MHYAVFATQTLFGQTSMFNHIKNGVFGLTNELIIILYSCVLIHVHVLHGLWLLKLAHLLDVIHQISTVNVLHYKVQTILTKDK